jgi:16S rRNA processing protein RimM
MTETQGEDAVVIGRLLSPWGLRGWLQVHSFTDPREGIFSYRPWFIDGVEAKVEGHKISGKRLVVKLAGIETPEEARTWSQREITIHRDQLPALPAGEFYWHDLVGCEVVNQQGHQIGVVSQVLSTGANDVLDVQRSDSEANVLIPFVQETYISGVSLDSRSILVDWPTEWLDE